MEFPSAQSLPLQDGGDDDTGQGGHLVVLSQSLIFLTGFFLIQMSSGACILLPAPVDGADAGPLGVGDSDDGQGAGVGEVDGAGAGGPPLLSYSDSG